VKITVPRYLTIVAVVYLIAGTALFYWAGGFETRPWPEVFSLWPAVLGVTAIGPLITLVVMARWGDITGSIYFLPTVIHCFFVITLVVFAILENYYT